MRGSLTGERRSLSLSLSFLFFPPSFFSLNIMIFYYNYFNFICLFILQLSTSCLVQRKVTQKGNATQGQHSAGAALQITAGERHLQKTPPLAAFVSFQRNESLFSFSPGRRKPRLFFRLF